MAQGDQQREAVNLRGRRIEVASVHVGQAVTLAVETDGVVARWPAVVYSRTMSGRAVYVQANGLDGLWFVSPNSVTIWMEAADASR